MNRHENEPNPNPNPTGEPEPMDAFDRAWIETLAEPEPDLKRSEQPFVQAVMQRYDRGVHRPAPVAGRIGFGSLQFAAAAAVLLAALVGVYFLTQGGGDPPGTGTLANNNEPNPPLSGGDNKTQPDPGRAVAPVDPTKIKLGKLIAGTQNTVTQPASELTTTLRETPNALRVESLLDLFDNPVPQIKQMLEPLKPDNRQSRA